MANSSASDVFYYPIHVLRSDGRGYQITGLNALEDGDIVLERWEVIVGQHLRNQLAPKKEEKLYKLAGLPKGYELRYSQRKNDSTQRDYYLYGHPLGPECKYRTPGDFAPHVIWLVSNSNDYSQCWCEFCVKMVAEKKVPRPPVTEAGADETAPTGMAGAVVPIAGPGPANKAPQLAQPAQPPPGTTGIANVFRVGEMVWYRQTAWRLGLILAISPKDGGSPPKDDGGYAFTLAPLGHAILNQAPVIKEGADMRPFLTFSVPGIAAVELQDKEFDAVDWRAHVQRNSLEPDPQKRSVRMQLLGLEASKMAARTINDSHSFFNKLSELVTADGKIKIQSYTGLYLGAEMVRVGDPIRVNPPAVAGEDGARESGAVMLVSEIQHITTAWPTKDDAAAQSATPSLRLKGSVFRKVRARVPHPPTIVPAAMLGPAFQQEIDAHNHIEKDKSMGWGWMLVERDAVRTEAEVQGRFYVTNRLMTIIEPEKLRAATERGEVEEAQTYLNSRSHCGRNGRSIGLRAGRAATVGNAVSTQFAVPEGMVED